MFKVDINNETGSYLFEKFEKFDNKYTVTKRLGVGQFGNVYLVQVSTRIQRAMKVMKSDEIAHNELAVLIRLDHANIVKYYDHFEVNVRGETDLLSSVDLCVITEYCEVKFLVIISNSLFLIQ